MSKIQPRPTYHGMPLYQAADRQRSPGLSPATRDMGRWESTEETEARRALQEEGLALHEFVGFGSTQTDDALCLDCGLQYSHKLHWKARVAPRDVVLLQPSLPVEWEPDPDTYVDTDNLSLRRQPAADDLHVLTVYRLACTLPDCHGWQCTNPKHPTKQIRYSLEVQRADLRALPAMQQDVEPILEHNGEGRLTMTPSLRTRAMAKREPNWDRKPRSPQARVFFHDHQACSPQSHQDHRSMLERRYPGMRHFDLTDQ